MPLELNGIQGRGDQYLCSPRHSTTHFEPMLLEFNGILRGEQYLCSATSSNVIQLRILHPCFFS
jgi:hypothetical protein